MGSWTGVDGSIAPVTLVCKGIADGLAMAGVGDSDPSLAGIGIFVGVGRSVVRPHEATTSIAKMVAAMRTDIWREYIRLGRCDMLMNSTTFVRHWGSNV